MTSQHFNGNLISNPVHIYIYKFISEEFVDNLIFKRVRPHLFAASWMVSSIAI